MWIFAIVIKFLFIFRCLHVVYEPSKFYINGLITFWVHPCFNIITVKWQTVKPLKCISDIVIYTHNTSSDIFIDQYIPSRGASYTKRTQ